MCRHKKHGMRHTRLYYIYYDMIQRCYNCKHKYYKRYGGRDIIVCDEWLNDKTAFFDWAISHGYNDNLTIDRIDNDKGYSPSNCRWVDRTTQANNRSSSVKIKYNDETKTINEWIQKLNLKVSYQIIWQRLKHGWGVEKAFYTPKRGHIRELLRRKHDKD